MSRSTNTPLPVAEKSDESIPSPVVREAEYLQSPDQVWDALTDPDALSAWLMPATDFAPEPGRRFRFHPTGETASDDAIECQVTEAEPSQRLAYTWRTAPGRPPGRVTWTLTPTRRGGTRLRIVHEPIVTAPAACAFAVACGYCRPKRRLYTDMETHITRLTAVLTTGGTKL